MLQINDDEVELWVVKAITVKLIDCKMDQMNQVVIVRCTLSSLSLSLSHTHTHTHTLASIIARSDISTWLLICGS
jgi:translation initiation factor 3 subunit M